MKHLPDDRSPGLLHREFADLAAWPIPFYKDGLQIAQGDPCNIY